MRNYQMVFVSLSLILSSTAALAEEYDASPPANPSQFVPAAGRVLGAGELGVAGMGYVTLLPPKGASVFDRNKVAAERITNRGGESARNFVNGKGEKLVEELERSAAKAEGSVAKKSLGFGKALAKGATKLAAGTAGYAGRVPGAILETGNMYLTLSVAAGTLAVAMDGGVRVACGNSLFKTRDSNLCDYPLFNSTKTSTNDGAKASVAMNPSSATHVSQTASAGELK